MPNKEQLTKTASSLGIEIDPQWSNKEIQAAINGRKKRGSSSDSPAERRRGELLASASDLGIKDADELDTPTLEAAVDDASEERVTIDVHMTVTTIKSIEVKSGRQTVTAAELAASGLEPRHYTRVGE